MPKITKIVVTSSLSKNYQKAEVTMEAEVEIPLGQDYTKEEVQNSIDSYFNFISGETTQKATELLNSFPASEVPSNKYASGKTYAPNTYKAPYANRQIQPQEPKYVPQAQPRDPNRPASEKQLNYIKGLGYTGEMPTTFFEADSLLKQLKGK